MATRNLGQAAIVSKGAYSSGQAYIMLNTVTHRGGSFMCIVPCQGVEPGVSANWQNYWVATAKGIRSIAITSATEGTATVTVTFSDNTTYSNTYSTTPIPDGSVTNAKLASNSVGTSKLIDGAVSRAKINDNAVSEEKIAAGAVTAGKIAANAVSTLYTTTLDTTWSGSSAPYSKAQTVSGILSTDYPIVDIVPSSTYSTAMSQEQEFAKIYRIVASANTLTFYAKEKPTVSLPIKVLCVRK